MNQTQFVSIGANLPGRYGATPRASCEAALRAMAALAYCTGLVRSRWYSTGPVPASDQPRYINAVARLHGTVSPAQLLADLNQIEAQAGRVRGAANAARVLDLDIIDLDGLVRDAPDPILPHPRAHLRAFVLLPLRDVAPCWVHPRLRASIDMLLGALPPQDIRLQDRDEK